MEINENGARFFLCDDFENKYKAQF
jgi:hypothetical protein